MQALKALLIFFILNFSTHANCFDKVAEVFEDLYSDKVCGYQFKLCQQNVMRMVKKVQESEKDISNINILYIKPTPDADDQIFHVRYGRDGFNEDMEVEEHVVFEYHFVVEVDGKIFDFDYGPVPTIEPRKDYLDNFMTDDDVIEYDGEIMGPITDLEFYKIPAQEFLKLGKGKALGINNQMVIDLIPTLYSAKPLNQL